MKEKSILVLHLPSGEKQYCEGLVIERNGDNFIIGDTTSCTLAEKLGLIKDLKIKFELNLCTRQYYWQIDFSLCENVFIFEVLLHELFLAVQ